MLLPSLIIYGGICFGFIAIIIFCQRSVMKSNIVILKFIPTIGVILGLIYGILRMNGVIIYSWDTPGRLFPFSFPTWEVSGLIIVLICSFIASVLGIYLFFRFIYVKYKKKIIRKRKNQND